MKKILLLTLMFATCIFMTNAQSQVIIEEDFQDWEATEDTDDASCSAGVVIEDSIRRYLTLTVTGGTAQIPVTLIKCGIAPECESRRIEDGGASQNLPGVTTGWVLLNKLSADNGNNTRADFENSVDTIGQFIFGPVPQIDSIRFAHSATGAQRGIRIYTSTDGKTWERPTEDEFWDGNDTQLGDVNSVTINKTDVYIKFTSGFDDDDPYTSEYSRLHNITVYGTPGEVQVGISKLESNQIKAYPNPAHNYLFLEFPNNVINSHVQVVNILGAQVLNTIAEKQKIKLDISSLDPGIYFIRVTDGNDRYVKQLIIK